MCADVGCLRAPPSGDLPVAVAADAITLLSDNPALIGPFSTLVKGLVSKSSTPTLRVNELEIMSREDEISLNAKSIYLVIVGGEKDIYSVRSAKKQPPHTP